MQLIQSKCNGFTLRQWTCCGNLWELYLSRRYPERYEWEPVCEECSLRKEILQRFILKKGKEMNDQVLPETVQPADQPAPVQVPAETPAQPEAAPVEAGVA